mmetsp:Transcript_8144/g.14486  ORF Transcript_8144/g.14486 Transcript_8144/m.14486 type:complete len:94 (-) Transcript_8144:505-786(-)
MKAAKVGSTGIREIAGMGDIQTGEQLEQGMSEQGFLTARMVQKWSRLNPANLAVRALVFFLINLPTTNLLFLVPHVPSSIKVISYTAVNLGVG